MASSGCNSLEKNEQLRNLDQVFSTPRSFSPTIRRDVRQVIMEFMKKYQLEHKVRFRDNIGSVVEQIHCPDDHPRYLNYYRLFLYRVTFWLSTNSQLSVFLEIRRPWFFTSMDDRAETCRHTRETYIYQEVFPRIRAAWPKGRQPPFPRLSASTTSGILLFENLSEFNSQTRSMPSLDLAEAKTVMKSLACFHASSIPIIKAKAPRAECETEIPLLIIEIVYSCSENVRLFCQAFETFREQVYPQVGEGVQKEFEKFVKDLPEILETYYQPNMNGLNVIVHGELNTRNILFDGTGQCQFLDFQRSRCASPALDVVFFLMSSVKIEIVESECDSLLSCYLEEFNQVLAHAGERYHQETFHADLLEQKSYIVYNLLRVAMLWTEQVKNSDSRFDMVFQEVLLSDKFMRAVKHWVKFLQSE